MQFAQAALIRSPSDIWILLNVQKIFDHVIVAVMVNPEKHTMFTTEERIALIQKCTNGMGGVEVVSFDGLLADYAKMRGATAIVKGLRAMSDFEYEFQQALTNRKLNSELETVFMITRSENMFLSSSIVKQIANFGGDVSTLFRRVSWMTSKKECMPRRSKHILGGECVYPVPFSHAQTLRPSERMDQYDERGRTDRRIV